MQATKIVYDDLDRDGIYSRAVTDTFYNDDGSQNYILSYLDNENDGVIDYYQSQFNGWNGDGTKSFDVSYVDYGYDGLDSSVLTYYGYDANLNVNSQLRYEDNNGDGSYETLATSYTATYNAANQLLTERNDSSDWNGDGAPDYSDETTYSYSATGKVTAAETLYYFDGAPNMVDYRLEKYTYNSKDLLVEYRIDDWSEYDFEIAYHYKYTSSGQLKQVKYEDPFLYGDDRPRTTETYFWNQDGSLKESNLYDEYMNGIHVLEDKAKFTYDSDGLLTKEVHTGQDSSWNTVTGWQDELWYDDQGRLTTKLTSFDQNGDGVYEAGTRTLEQWAFDAGYTEHSIDYNAGDGYQEFVEYEWIV